MKSLSLVCVVISFTMAVCVNISDFTPHDLSVGDFEITVYEFHQRYEKGVVLLQSGVFSNHMDWLALKENSLVSCLIEDGWSVWLLNNRGNKLNENWAFSFVEMGTGDLPAIFDFIFARTASQIHYVGFSQGATQLFALGGIDPKRLHVLASVHMLAPSIHLSNTPSGLFKTVGHVTSKMFVFDSKFPFTRDSGGREFQQYLTRPKILKLFGIEVENVDSEILIAFLFPDVAAYASSREIAHYGQLMAQQKFSYFNFGIFGNFLRYGSLSPPIIDIYNPTFRAYVRQNMYVYYGERDTNVTPDDTRALFAKIRPRQVTKLNATHLSFLIDRNAKQLVYNKLIANLNQHPTTANCQE